MNTVEKAQHALNVAKVRAWMSEDGSAPKRGRISRETILAYNAATGESLPVPEVKGPGTGATYKPREVTVYGFKVSTDKAGRENRRAVVFTEQADVIRETLRAAGETVGERGRFSAAMLQRYIDVTA